MADGEIELTKEQLEVLRRRLEDERSRILRILQASAATAPPEEETEMEESAQRATERTHALGVAERERALLAEVERALVKIRGGTYGRSEATGDPIPFARLSAVPWARTGVDE